jgi:hypothetical protein
MEGTFLVLPNYFKNCLILDSNLSPSGYDPPPWVQKVHEEARRDLSRFENSRNAEA